MTRVGIKTAHGRSITKLAIFAQAPSSFSFSMLKENGIFPLKTRRPIRAKIAGKTITENTIAILTDKVPPIPKLGRPVFSKNSIPIRPIATVIPEKNTALPAVATVIAVDVFMSRPLFNSSLNRFTMKRE